MLPRTSPPSCDSLLQGRGTPITARKSDKGRPRSLVRMGNDASKPGVGCMLRVALLTPWRGSPQALTLRGLYNKQGGEALNICSACTSKTDGKGNPNGFPISADRYPRGSAHMMTSALCSCSLAESVSLKRVGHRLDTGASCDWQGDLCCDGQNRAHALSRQVQRRGRSNAGAGDRSWEGPLSAQIPPSY